MIVEERIYTLQVGEVKAYLDLYESEGMDIQKRILGRMLGYYFTDIGPLNQIIHMWGYEDLKDREIRRRALFADSGWLAYVAKVRPLVVKQENKILMPAPFFTPAG